MVEVVGRPFAPQHPDSSKAFGLTVEAFRGLTYSLENNNVVITFSAGGKRYIAERLVFTKVMERDMSDAEDAEDPNAKKRTIDNFVETLHITIMGEKEA